MSDSDLKERVAKQARLPPFCTITDAGWLTVMDSKTLKPKKVLCARFTFPGATDRGSWRADLRNIVSLTTADYETYQRLKAEWIKGEQGDDGET